MWEGLLLNPYLIRAQDSYPPAADSGSTPILATKKAQTRAFFIYETHRLRFAFYVAKEGYHTPQFLPGFLIY